MSSCWNEVAGGLLVSKLVRTEVAGGLLVSRLVIYSVCESWPYIQQKTRKQTNSKGIKSIIKINFPICKMSHTH